MAERITKLSELRTGHIIKTRNGGFYMLFKGSNVFYLYDTFVGLSDNTDCLFLDDFNIDFKNKNDKSEWDIVAVYEPDFSHCGTYRGMLQCLAHTVLYWPAYNMNNIYEEPTKKLTVSQVAKLLGYNVEIVKENKKGE